MVKSGIGSLLRGPLQPVMMYCNHEAGAEMNLSNADGKTMKRRVRIGLQCGFDKMWQDNGCGLKGVSNKEKKTIQDQLQRNSQFNLSIKLHYMKE